MNSYRLVVTARVGKAIFIRWFLQWPAATGPLLLRLGLFGATVFSIVTHVALSFWDRFHAFSVAASTAQTYCAPFGGHKSVQLGDASTVELNSGTCITADISSKARAIGLDAGEAIFQVAHDPARPFVVKSGPISIEALGTQFDVYRRDASTRVAVVEGVVQVGSLDATSRSSGKPLAELQQIEVPDNPALARVRKNITPREFDQMTAWIHGAIVLKQQSLKGAFSEFARYQHIQVEYKDPHIAEVPFDGNFRTTDLDSFLKLLNHRCIHSEYDKVSQRITLTTVAGKRAGTQCS